MCFGQIPSQCHVFLNPTESSRCYSLGKHWVDGTTAGVWSPRPLCRSQQGPDFSLIQDWRLHGCSKQASSAFTAFLHLRLILTGTDIEIRETNSWCHPPVQRTWLFMRLHSTPLSENKQFFDPNTYQHKVIASLCCQHEYSYLCLGPQRSEKRPTSKHNQSGCQHVAVEETEHLVIHCQGNEEWGHLRPVWRRKTPGDADEPGTYQYFNSRDKDKQAGNEAAQRKGQQRGGQVLNNWISVWGDDLQSDYF